MLGLKAELENGQIRITWDRTAESTLTAESGLLSIEDGGLTRQIQLSGAQVRNASVLFPPTTGEVQIQLAVLGPKRATELVLFVFSKKRRAPETEADIPEKAPAHLYPRKILVPVPRPFEVPEARLSSLPEVQPSTFGSTAGEGVNRPPTVRTRVTPLLPPQAPGVTAPTIVAVKVAIDVSGRVSNAEALSKRVSPPFVAAALSAARQWVFEPARSNGAPVPSELVLEFKFMP